MFHGILVSMEGSRGRACFPGAIPTSLSEDSFFLQLQMEPHVQSSQGFSWTCHLYKYGAASNSMILVASYQLRIFHDAHSYGIYVAVP